MKRLPATILVVVLLMAACGNDARSTNPSGSPAQLSPLETSASTFTPGSAADVGRYFRISEVGLAPNGYVTLVNYTDQPASLDTLFLCQSRGCVDLPQYTVEPGAAARIATGDGERLADVAMTRASLDLEPSDGEVALFSSNDIGDPRALHAYLEWGKTPHTLTSQAISADLWLDGSFAPTAADATRLFQNDSGLWLFDTE